MPAMEETTAGAREVTGDEHVRGGDEQLMKPVLGGEGVAMDVGNLCVSVRDGGRSAADGAEERGRIREEEQAKELAQMAVQELVHALLKLPRTAPMMTTAGAKNSQGKGSAVVKLPVGTTPLPREKPLPKPREETPWQKFAREKGIAPRKKRDRMVWDEEAQEWKPRFGYKRTTGRDADRERRKTDSIAVPHDETTAKALKRGEDPFATADRAKAKLREASRAHSEQLAERRGLVRRSSRKTDRRGMSTVLPALEGEKSGAGKGKLRLDSKRLRGTLKAAQVSTASAGVFDSRLANEKAPAFAKGRNQRRLADAVSNGKPADEQRNAMKVLRTVLVKHQSALNGTGGESAVEKRIRRGVENTPTTGRKKRKGPERSKNVIGAQSAKRKKKA